MISFHPSSCFSELMREICRSDSECFPPLVSPEANDDRPESQNVVSEPCSPHSVFDERPQPIEIVSLPDPVIAPCPSRAWSASIKLDEGGIVDLPLPSRSDLSQGSRIS